MLAVSNSDPTERVGCIGPANSPLFVPRRVLMRKASAYTVVLRLGEKWLNKKYIGLNGNVLPIKGVMIVTQMRLG